MGFGFKKILNGIRLRPNATTKVTEVGDLDTTVDGKLRHHDGTSPKVIVTETTVQTLTNKSIDADTNTITNIENADIKSGAAIDATKIADGSVSNAEFQQLNGILSSAIGSSDVQTLTNKTIDADLNTITNIENADIKVGAAIDATKIADGSISNSEFQQLNGILSSAVGISDSQVLTNKTIDADLNSISNIENADIKAGAAIDVTKLADGSISNAEFQQLNGVTSSVVGVNDTQTLTNKTIDGDNNTVQDLSLGSLKTVLGDANKFIVRDALGAVISDKAVPTGVVVGTTDVQVITNKDIDGGSASNTSRITVPSGTKASLDGLTRKQGTIVYANDTAKGYFDNGTNLVEIGSSGGGINYIQNNDGSVTTGYAAYADAADTKPVNGTGGSGSITITTSAVTPLAGTSSFILTKPASNVQGHGISYDFTIDRANQSKQLKVEFDYLVNSGTFVAGSSSVNSDIVVYLYDVTNSRLIEPSNPKLLSNTTGPSDRYTSSFTTSPDSVNYRLILHCATTSTSALSLKIDNIVVSPISFVEVANLSPKKAFTPSGSWAGTYTGFIKRIGDEAFVDFYLSSSGAQTGVFTITPAQLLNGLNLSLDTSKMLGVSGDTATSVGTFHILQTGVQVYTGNVRYVASSNHFSLTGNTSGGAANSPSAGLAGDVGSTTPITVSANTRIGIQVRIPILGWGVSQTMSDVVDNRTMICKLSASGPISLPNTTSVTLLTSGLNQIDTHGCVDAAIGRITVKKAGRYQVSTYIRGENNPSSSGQFICQVYLNGTQNYEHMVRGLNVVTFQDTARTAILNLNAGDYLEIKGYHDCGSNRSITAAEINVMEIPNSAVPITSSDAVHCSYTLNAIQSVPSPTETVVKYLTKKDDSHNAYDTVTGTFTVPVSGRYLITPRVLFQLNSSGERVLYIRKNGSTFESVARLLGNGSADIKVQGSTVVNCVAGDTLQISVIQNSGVSLDIKADSLENGLTITKI